MARKKTSNATPRPAGNEVSSTLLVGYDGLPTGWKQMQFGDVIRMASGQVDPRESPYSDYMHVGPENIESDSGTVSNLRSSRELGLMSGKYLFDEDAIVYCKIRPNLNKVCVPGFVGVCSADAYPIWPLPDRIDRDYLTQFMRSPLFVRQAVAVSMRTGMPKINQPELKRLSIVVPPLDQQTAIATFLSVWDRAIGKLAALITVKERLKLALMQQLLTGQIRLCGCLTDWQPIHLGDIFSNRKEPGGTGLPLLSVTLNEGIVRRETRDSRVVRTSLNDESHLLVREGDIAYNTMRMWQGGCGVASEDGLISPAYVVCQPTKQIDSQFAHYLFQAPHMIYRFWAYSYGLTDDRRRLYYDSFALVPVSLPPVKEQRRIATLLTTLDAQLSHIRCQRFALGKQKRGLMQQLLTGKKCVSESLLKRGAKQ